MIFNLRFPGQYYDTETGLYHNGFRDFDPAIGRYIESDPIGLLGGSNTYAYVGSNPVGAWDRSGLLGSGPPEEEEPKAEGPIENAYEELAVQSQVFSLVQNIRQYNPGFQYSIVGPPGVRHTEQDVQYLQQILRDYRSQNSCPAPSTVGRVGTLLQRYLAESGGRWGSSGTRALTDRLASQYEAQGYRIIGGAGRAPEEWIPGPGGGTKGGTFIDITATNGTSTVRIQTISTLADGVTPTPAEAAAAGRIRTAFPNDQLILVPK